MKRLTKEQVLRMHDALICETGGMGGRCMENRIKKDGSLLSGGTVLLRLGVGYSSSGVLLLP